MLCSFRRACRGIVPDRTKLSFLELFLRALSSQSRMDADLWTARLAAVKRHHTLQHSQNQWDRLLVDDLDADDEVRPEFTCPYCYEDFGISHLCSHLLDEHLFESRGVVCPVCATKVARDMVGHITMQHSHLFKNNRRWRFRMAGVPPTSTRSLLGKEYREALLGGLSLRSSGGPSSQITDSLLSALVNSFPTSDSEELVLQNHCLEKKSSKRMTSVSGHKTRIDVSLSEEERERQAKQATQRANFVQQLVLSTLKVDI